MGPSPRLLAMLLACPGCFFPDRGDENPPPPDAPPPDIPGCITAATRTGAQIPLSGTIVDFVTGAPVAGAIVDVTTGWDVDGYVPRAACPLIATFTTGGDGRFGPLTIDAGSTEFPPILLLFVHGGDRGKTSFDIRSSCTSNSSLCDPLDVSIPAASATLDSAWRSELAAGGMIDAATRSLVAFEFKNTDQTGAANVIPFEGNGAPHTLVPNIEVRFLGADRATIEPTSATATTDSGIALVGRDIGTGRIDVGGNRGNERWPNLGCLLASGFTFFEDKTVAP